MTREIDWFLGNGIPVIPLHGIENGVCTCSKGARCPSPGKHPLMSRWQLLATLDRGVIQGWIGSGRKPINLGVVTGRRNLVTGRYLVVLDLDQENHPLLELVRESGGTVLQRTGGGGVHAFYWSDHPVRNSVRLVGSAADIRGSGGLLVVAPSVHKTGRVYELDFTMGEEIQPIPAWLVSRVRSSLGRTNRTTTPQTHLPDGLNRFWMECPVPRVRTILSEGRMVPVGVRNSLMHRLLASDRARGAESGEELRVKALGYLRWFEDHRTFAKEIPSIIRSVLKYPAYNNSHERVNELYCKWLTKRGTLPERTVQELNLLDEEFFGRLRPVSNGGVSLAQVGIWREAFLRNQGIQAFASWKAQLLAKKLSSLGFLRKRTTQRNLWMVDFNLEVCQTVVVHQPAEERLSMATEVKDEQEKKGLKDGDVIDYHGEKCRVEIQKIPVKVKEHSREHLYQGKTGYEYGKAIRALLPRLTEEMMDSFEKGELVMDREKTETWLREVNPGDIIGVKADRYQVKDPGILDPFRSLPVNKVRPVPGKPGEFTETHPEAPILYLSLPEIDHARELGMLDILWRGGAPYGEPATKEATLVLLHPLETPEESTSPTADKAPKPIKKKKKQSQT